MLIGIADRAGVPSNLIERVQKDVRACILAGQNHSSKKTSASHAYPMVRHSTEDPEDYRPTAEDLEWAIAVYRQWAQDIVTAVTRPPQAKHVMGATRHLYTQESGRPAADKEIVVV